MISLKLVESCKSFAHSSQSISNIKLPICSDTRAYTNPSFFIAYPGQRSNPLNHLDTVLSAGCPLVVYQDSQENTQIVIELQSKYPKTTFVKVSDAITFTQELALAHIEEWKRLTQGKIFAISGSNGKTTHKEMLSFLLKTVMPDEVIATEKNHNNHLGVPLTLLRINEKTKICVLELGSNHPGEIKVLCDLSHPDCGLVTNIGATHLEFFETEENVFTEEGYLYYGMNPQGLFFQNLDDPFLCQFKKRSGTLTFSSKSKADLTYSAREGEVEINGVLGHEILRNKFLTGSHNLTNLATSWAIAVSLFPEKRGVLTAAASRESL
jgi:UDP-N-acetylmuramoyl-tripeptide--D-alanyl-D-alanine ligase